ncbi:MAG: PEP-utilizing enzyme [Nanoarchaeota archaeon]
MGEITNKQLSLVEWLARVNYKNINELRVEDDSKRERLEFLSNIINIKFDKQDKFPALDFFNSSTFEIKDYISKKISVPCSFRLVSNDPLLPKLRVRGKSLNDNIEWLKQQKVDLSKYELHIGPHVDPIFSTIFIIAANGIQGEIIKGAHNELTQGYTNSNIMSFFFDFNNWNFSNNSLELQEEIKKTVSNLVVNDISKQDLIKEKLDGEFINNYLLGYFESTTWPNNDIVFIDYNRILYKDINTFSNVGNSNELSGQIANRGLVRGFVKLVSNNNLYLDINNDEILVCDMTSIEYLPLMSKSLGVITSRGGILSHAAIVCRELKKPCLVGVYDVINKLNNKDFIELDANNGIIRKLSNL